MVKKQFKIIRVATKDIVTDAFQGIRNLFGFRLRGYEKMLTRYIDDVIKEMNEKYNPIWFRLIVNPLAKQSAMIILYGEYDE